MKLSKLIKTLQAAKKQFGDVPVQLMNEESGHYHPIGGVLKLHPYTGVFGCMNRQEPVNAVALHRGVGWHSDLVLASK